jgi:PAS domain S-box-containing protein
MFFYVSIIKYELRKINMDTTSPLECRQYRLILDSLSEGVCTVDMDWNITSFNKAAEYLTGVNEGDARRLSFGDIFRCEICACQSILSGVMKSGEAIQGVNTKIVDKKGNFVPIALNAAPFRNEAGQIEGVVAIFRDDRQIEVLRKELRHDFTYGDIISKNDRMRRIFDILPNVAKSESTILIFGQSGTGKELFARAIHNDSQRKDKPFVAVNCGALPDNLLESELFGYKKGAFTDAKTDKPGRFALAQNGTLFLDEIGDISQAMQVKLLRVLQEKQYEPLGGTAPVNSDVRILAATNKNLVELMEQGEFRSDLYYRLNVIQIDLPSLSERPEDIPLLSEHFIEKLNAENGRNIKGISAAAMGRLMRYRYPGNIRELQNIIERAYIVCRSDEIQEQCLPPSVLECAANVFSNTSNGGNGAGDNKMQYVNLRSLSEEEEKKLLFTMLQKNGGSRKDTAAELGINPSTLWRKLKKYNI